MAGTGVNEQGREDALVQFLAMTDDRIDLDVAQSLLEAVGWDVAAAIEQLYGGPVASSASTSRASMEEESYDGCADEDLDLSALDRLCGSGAQQLEGYCQESLPRSSIAPLSSTVDSFFRAVLATDCDRAQTTSEPYRAPIAQEPVERDRMLACAREEIQERQRLRSEQEAEYAECLLIDQMREMEAREKVEAEQAAAHAQAEEQAMRAQALQASQERQAHELEEKRAALPAEPAIGEAGRLALLLRLPSGQRLQRAFRDSALLGAVYDYIDVMGHRELGGQEYHLVSTMPRKTYDTRLQSLAEAGIRNQFALMVELIDGL